MIGRAYIERGRPVIVLARWAGPGPRNVLIRRADGSRTVRPFRGLRRPRTEAEILAALVAIWSASGWRRLEACRTPAGLGGYCAPADSRPVLTGDVAEVPGCPAPVAEMVELLAATGWQRLEIVGRPGSPTRYGGLCLGADGSPVRIGRAAA